MEPLLNPCTFDWILLPNHSHVLKFVVKQSGYHILLSNLNFIYGENLQEGDVHKRFHELNHFADMKSDLILMNIEKSLNEFVGDLSSHILQEENDKFILILKFSTRLMNYKYEVRLNLLPANQITDFIIRPIIMSSLLCEQKIKELENIVSADKVSSVVTLDHVSRKSLPVCNSTTTSMCTSNPDCERKQLSFEMLVISFAKLQNFFDKLASESNKSDQYICEDGSVLPKKVANEKRKPQFLGPVKYEEENYLENNRVTEDSGRTVTRPLGKRQKKRNLNI